MADFIDLLRRNRNYRYTWLGQVVSETGDYFNNIAVFSLVMEVRLGAGGERGDAGAGDPGGAGRTHRGRGAGPFRPQENHDRERPDPRRGGAGVHRHGASSAAWLLYVLSGLLMFASPFFTSGRAAILPTIASKEELHTANSLTQTTQWATLTAGTMLAGLARGAAGVRWAFVLNSLSFRFFGVCGLAVAHAGRFRGAAAERPRSGIGAALA